MIGEEFKTARMHLLKNLEGNMAWKDPSQAEAQIKRRDLSRSREDPAPEESQSRAAPTEIPLPEPEETDDFEMTM